MIPGYAGVLVTPKAQAEPVALAAQAAGLLECSTLELRRAIDELVLTNPLVDIPPDGGGFDPMNYVTRTETLSDHLATQLRIAVCDPVVLPVCWFIINSLDGNGYLREDEAEICRLCGCTGAVYNAALRQVQQLEPTGVGARNLSECLCLQLEAMDEPNPLALTVARFHLEELAAGTLALPGRTQEELDEAAALIRSLQPRPGSHYDEGAIPYVLPDILVEQCDGQLEVSLINQPGIPSLNAQYAAMVRDGTMQERQYVREHLAYARSFLFALQQRCSTLLAVAAFAAAHQADYLLRCGAVPPRALTLTDAALALGVNVSTVSRAVKDKYVQCDRRVFPLRDLFTSGGAAQSSRQEITVRIRDICQRCGEQISDRAVAELLAEDGIVIARRTVNKYRKAMAEGGKVG